jgi:3-deoxy-D-manno-octulosonate 8-phosphate phosphatase (KDO 8-P phosphatase)
MGEILRDNIAERLKAIRWLVLDVDGVLTDGWVILDNNGEEMKHFNVRDGHALKMIQRYGIHIMLLTGRSSQVVVHRARELNITEVHQRVLNKLEYFTEFMNQRGLTFAEIAYVGDDVVDIPLLRQAGFSATVKDAAEEVFPLVDYVSPCEGGRGAVRDICKLILKAQGKWEEVARRYHFPESL